MKIKRHIRFGALFSIATLLVSCAAFPGGQTGGSAKLLASLDGLVLQLAQNLPMDKKPVIGVVDFVGPDDKLTRLGAGISEKLVTRLFKTGRFEKIVERSLLKQVLMQQKLERSGHFDEGTLADIGRKAGAGAIVAGTIKVMGAVVDINARLIDSKTGEILAVAETQLGNSDDTREMLEDVLTSTLTITLVEEDEESGFETIRRIARVSVGTQNQRIRHGTAVFRTVPHGSCTIVVSALGYGTVTENIYIAGDQSHIVNMKAQSANLTLQLTPRDAVVMIDGIRKQQTHEGILSVQLSNGPHTILVSGSDGYCPEDMEIDLAQDTAITVELRKSADGQGCMDDKNLMLRRMTAMQQATPPFNVQLWADKKEYAVGDTIAFNFKSERDCYLTLIDIAVNGKITILFPNRFHPDNFIYGGVTYRVPEDDYGFEYKVLGPRGTEHIKAIATLENISLQEYDFTQTVFRDVSRAKDLDDMKTGLDRIQKGWSEARCSVLIK